MSHTAQLDAAPRRRHIPWGPVILLLVGLVAMAATAFLQLIQEPIIPAGFLTASAIAGLLAAAAVMYDRRLSHDGRVMWALWLALIGTAALLLAVVLIYYVLPL